MLNLERIREEELYIKIIYYIKHLDDIRTCQNIVNSTDKLQPSTIRILDVYWQKPGVTSHMHTYIHGTQAINLV
jgi:hypothetical protein